MVVVSYAYVCFWLRYFVDVFSCDCLLVCLISYYLVVGFGFIVVFAAGWILFFGLFVYSVFGLICLTLNLVAAY